MNARANAVRARLRQVEQTEIARLQALVDPDAEYDENQQYAEEATEDD